VVEQRDGAVEPGLRQRGARDRKVDPAEGVVGVLAVLGVRVGRASRLGHAAAEQDEHETGTNRERASIPNLHRAREAPASHLHLPEASWWMRRTSFATAA
jgi:hypothetical protein